MSSKSKNLGSSLFQVGDLVTWKSQAGGSLTKKTGTVIEYVLARQSPKIFKSTSTRNHDSYIIEVLPAEPKLSSKPHRVKKPERYWPLVGNLHLVQRRVGSVVMTTGLVQIIKTSPDMRWSDIPKVDLDEPSAPAAQDWLDVAASNSSSPENSN